MAVGLTSSVGCTGEGASAGRFQNRPMGRQGDSRWEVQSPLAQGVLAASLRPFSPADGSRPHMFPTIQLFCTQAAEGGGEPGPSGGGCVGGRQAFTPHKHHGEPGAPRPAAPRPLTLTMLRSPNAANGAEPHKSQCVQHSFCASIIG